MNKKISVCAFALSLCVLTAVCQEYADPANNAQLSVNENRQEEIQKNEQTSENREQNRLASPAEGQSTLTQSAAKQKPDALKLYTAGRYAEAIAVCEKEIAERPSNMDSYVVLCWSLIRNRQYSEAEYWGLQSRKLSKYDQRAVEVLGEAKYYLGKNQEALSLFQEYVSLVGEKGSRLGEAYYFMGEIYIRLARYNHADIAFSQAVRTEPLYDYWWTRLGYAREMAGNYTLSLAAYEKALQLHAGQVDALRGRDRVRTRL